MDRIADELRTNPTHVDQDDQIAFRQLQKMLLPDFPREQFLYVYDLWCEHYAGQQVIDDAERAALYDSLCDERDVLFSARERFPEHRVELTARLWEVGRGLAELMPRLPAAPLRDWV
jgi:hypothetical protein